jgi:iron complex outermembrane receptor protein
MITYAISDDLQVKSITGYVDGHRFLQQDLTLSSFSVGDSLQSTDERLLTEELQANGTALDNRLKYAAGFYYYDKSATDNQAGYFFPILHPTASEFANTVRVSSYSGYAQGSFAVTPQINITGGIRYTTENKTLIQNLAEPTASGPLQPAGTTFTSSANNISYLAEIDYTPITRVMAYFKTSESYRSGGPQDTAPAGTPDFRPETVTDYEVGVKSDLLDRHLRLNLDYYHERYLDVQQAIFFPSGNILVNGVFNVGNADVDGFELQVIAVPIQHLTLSAAASIMDPRYTWVNPVAAAYGNVHKDSPLGNVQRYAYSLSGDYLVPTSVGDVNAHLDWRWQSETYFTPGLSGAPPAAGVTYQPSYGLLNGRISFTPGNGNVELALWGKNLLNQAYSPYINDQTGTFGFINNTGGPPMTFGGEVTWKF